LGEGVLPAPPLPLKPTVSPPNLTWSAIISTARFWFWEQTVFQRILKQIREKVRQRQYVMTLHAEEEMSDDNLSIFDVERSLLTGEIVERQKDAVTGEWKYLVKGYTVAGDEMMTVAKISPTGKLVIITVYRL